MAKYSPKNAPFVGKGRWTWCPHAMNDVLLMIQVEERGLTLRSELQKLHE
jgi:hypothetical protein